MVMYRVIIFLLFFFSGFSICNALVINEIGWMGTTASSNDEWIELFNNSDESIDLTGWVLEAQDGSPVIALEGTINPQAYFILERTDDETIPTIIANQIYSGSLSNSGEHLILKDFDGNIHDEILTWYAGNSLDKKSMERIDANIAGSEETNWQDFLFSDSDLLDAKNNPLFGTPGKINSIQENDTDSKNTHNIPPEENNTDPEQNNEPPENIATLPIDITINEIEYEDDWIEIFCRICPDQEIQIRDLTLFKNNSSSIFLSFTSEEFLKTDDRILIFLRQGASDETPLKELITGGRLITIYSTKSGLASEGLLRLEHKTQGEVHRLSWDKYPSDAYESFIFQEDQRHTWTTQKTPGYKNILLKEPETVNIEEIPPKFKTFIPEQHKQAISIHEIFMNPEGSDAEHEFIEMYNSNPAMIDISGWKIDDIEGSGSKPYTIPDNTFIFPQSYYVVYQSQSGVNLNNTDDSVRILTPDDDVIDSYSYVKAKEEFSLSKNEHGQFEWTSHVTPGDKNIFDAETPAEEIEIPNSSVNKQETSILENKKDLNQKNESIDSKQDNEENREKEYLDIEELEPLSEIEKNTTMYKFRLFSQKGLVIKGKTVPNATILGTFNNIDISTISDDEGLFEHEIDFALDKGSYAYDIEIIAANGDSWSQKNIQVIDLVENYIPPTQSPASIKSSSTKTSASKTANVPASVDYVYKNVRSQTAQPISELEKYGQPHFRIYNDTPSLDLSWKRHEMTLFIILLLAIGAWSYFQWRIENIKKEK